MGYGYWGSKHVRVLSSMPDVSVTVVDISPERLRDAAARCPTVRTAAHLGHVIDDVDAVVVATPPSTHFPIANRALGAGRHVLVEKPMATSVPDAEALVATAARHGAQLMVGHTFEYNPAVRRLRDIIRSGVLGRILYIDAARLNLGQYQRDVNVIWDLAPHDISIASYLLDELPVSTAVWACRNIGRRHADVAYLRLDFPTTHAFVHVSWLNPNKVRRTTVVGEQKMAIYDDLSDNERIRIYDIGVDPAGADDAQATGDMPVSYRTGDITSPYVPFREPLMIQDGHFVECIRTGRQPDTPGERGLEVVRVLAATDRAIATGQSSPVFGAPGVAPVLVPSSRAAS
ncbi:Gfo/Idh/MocA family protein [Pseudonocardia acidicola]|uniref:Gfo/Idh/MocA family oxidoreductase n=1 Tax=Pseudonocardia acidicola TaxID=2724939 RepID=A0ABX1SFD7_9PSEU|nr:Gfo/Idh/MocA family oxidoreductase [Pseudonocardia acidicola]NMI00267.1 Gfo/Idh/MocA family oxidoreductase [Pseudonocardia acidicola]